MQLCGGWGLLHTHSFCTRQAPRRCCRSWSQTPPGPGLWQLAAARQSSPLVCLSLCINFAGQGELTPPDFLTTVHSQAGS